ncbi:GNAT family N-acetyltransferase [Qipengyuania sp. MTN3-11]|uniref:GNAT family N-acetyltransferase n=1 Tax=Qipengyuania sp. MTN3-11 TaxID=3056557 RepID=UPI0036F20748
MADIVLETERLILRTIEECDAALQFHLLNSPAIMDQLGGPKELHEIEAKHARAMASHVRDGFSFLMMIEKPSGELVGHCGLKRVDHPAAPNQGDFEIGWLVREDRWRRGYAFEAASAVLEWAFCRHDAAHVVALTGTRNRASWRMMEKLGMRRTAECDFDDPDYPPEDRLTIQYRIDRAAWEARA